MKKVILSVVITLLVAACAVPLTINIAGLTNVATVKVNTENVKTIYDLNEEFSADGLKVEASKGKGALTEITDYTVDSSAFKADTVGTYEIKVVVDKKDYASYTVEVKDKGSLSLASDNLFYVDQDIEESALKIKYTPTNGEAKEITDYKIISCNNNEVGNKTLVVEYQSFRYNISVNVVSIESYVDQVMQKMLQNAIDNKFDVNSIVLERSALQYIASAKLNENILYCVTLEDSVKTEQWVNSETLTIIEKNTYLDGSTLPYFNLRSYEDLEDSYEDATLEMDLPTAYQYAVGVVNQLYKTSEPSKLITLHSYNTKDGLFTFSKQIVDLRRKDQEANYTLTIDLSSGNLVSAFSIPLDGEMNIDINPAVEVPAVPAVPTAQDKGVVSVKAGSKFPVKTGSSMSVVAPIGGGGTYEDLNLQLTLNGKTYPLYYQDYTVTGYDDSTVGTKTVIVNYNTFTYPVQIEIVSALDYVKYIYEIAKEETANKNDYIGAVSEVNDIETEYMKYDKFSDVLYCNNRNNATLPDNQRGEIWIESDGTVTKKGSTGNVTKTKFDSQEVALIATFQLGSEETMKLSEFIGYYMAGQTASQLDTIITNLTEEQLVKETPGMLGSGTQLSNTYSTIVIKVDDKTYTLQLSLKEILRTMVSDYSLNRDERSEVFDFDDGWSFNSIIPSIPNNN